jgi:rod shape-determining protein MreD
MRFAKYVVFFFTLILLQTTLLPMLAIGGLQPDAVLIGLVILGIRQGAVPAIIAGCLVGFVQDAFVTHLFGLSSLANSCAGFVAGYFSREKVKYNLQVTLGVVLATAVVHDVLYFLIYKFGGGIGFFRMLFRYALPTSFYTLALAFIIHSAWPGGLWGKR